jgi:hypothetical protein
MSSNLNTNAILNQLFTLINQNQPSRRTQENYQTQENTRNSGYGNTYNDHIRRQQHLISDLLEDYNHHMNNYARNIEKIVDLFTLLQHNLDNQLAENIRMANVTHPNTQPNSIPNTRTRARPNIVYNNQNEINNNRNNNNRNNNNRNTQNLGYPIQFEWFMRNPRPNLSFAQIQASTEDILYNTSMDETRCPITLEDFTEGERLMKIKHCGHYFKRSNLMNWLRRDRNTCPVCRYDLRNYINDNTVNNTNADLSNNNIDQREPSTNTENINPDEENEPHNYEDDEDDDDDIPGLLDDSGRNLIANNLSGIVRDVLSGMTNRNMRNIYDSSSNVIAEYSFEFF